MAGCGSFSSKVLLSRAEYGLQNLAECVCQWHSSMPLPWLCLKNNQHWPVCHEKKTQENHVKKEERMSAL